MAVLSALVGVASVISAFYFTSHIGSNRFVPNACTNVEALLSARVVGQDAAIRTLVNAVCEHTRDRPEGEPVRPLVISVHGPPGTGKTYTHTLLAKAMYNRNPETALRCPGHGCAGAKVLYGMNYVDSEQERQLDMVRQAIVDHIKHTPNPILVIEEYDKLDCKSRAMLKQLVRHPELIDESKSRMIIILESNMGFLDLVNLLQAHEGNKSNIMAETTERILRNASLTKWLNASCETIDDTVAFAATISQYVAFLPITREDMAILLEKELTYNYAHRVAALGGKLVWDVAVVPWLLGRGDYDEYNFPLDGASQAASLCVRHVAHLLRKFETERNKNVEKGGKGKQARGTSERLLPVDLRLVVAPGGHELLLVQSPAK